MEKRQCLQQMALGKPDSNMQKNETGPLSYTIHKIDSKWMKHLKGTIKILKRKQAATSLTSAIATLSFHWKHH